MEDNFRSNMRTPLPSIGRNSLYGRASLYNNPARSSMRPSDVGRLSYGNSLGMKKGLPSQMASKTSRPNRNVRDKQTIEENKAILRDFCTQKEVQLDMSGLKDPSTNFFLSLFESIYIQLDPDYDVKKVSIKDEFPKIMSILGYPLSIKSSTMSAVSSITSWPYILDALAWLASFVKKNQSLDVMSLTNSEDDRNIQRFCSYEYFTRCYKKFKQEHVNTPDAFEPELQMFRQCLFQNEKLSELEEISREKAALESELEELNAECCEEECDELESRVACYQKDHKSMVDYIKQANEAYADRQQMNQLMEEKIVECENQLQKLQEENDNQRYRIRHQAISAQQVRDANIKLANSRERLRQARSELSKWREDAPKLQSIIYKILSSIRDKISDISAEIVKTAEDFFSPEEQKRYGFNEIRSTRAMDVEACKERLKLLGDLRKKLLDKMDATFEQNRIKMKKTKDVIAECDREVQRADMELKKLEQDFSTVLKNEKRRIEDLKQQHDQAELDANVLLQKRNIAAEKLQRTENEIAMLKQELSQLQVAIERKKSEIDDQHNDLGAVEEGERIFEEHGRIRSIQSEQDEKMEALLSQHTDLLKLVQNVDIPDEPTS